MLAASGSLRKSLEFTTLCWMILKAREPEVGPGPARMLENGEKEVESPELTTMKRVQK
jgi:hypothetical protein